MRSSGQITAGAGGRAARAFEALYVHVPFCASKCAYCAFYSIPGAPESLRQRWMRRVREEFAEFAARSVRLRSVYVGGGTPTLLGAGESRAMFSAIRREFDVAGDAEITIECNPETLTPERADALAEAGVNRVSLGIQSWDAGLRRILGRRGAAEAAIDAVRLLQERGIRNLGADLIYAIPGQTLRQWDDDLRRTADLGLRHVSTYELTIEEGTRLAAAVASGNAGGAGGHPVRKNDDDVPKFWNAADVVLGEYGMRRYEVSNFAVPGSECRHNVWIWYGGTYAGCGPAAWSFDGVLRSGNPRDIEAWLAGAPAEIDPLPPDRRAAEVLGFGLRTAAGWDVDAFRARTGFDMFELRGQAIGSLVEDGLLEIVGGRIRPTPRGLLFADTIAERVL